MKKVLFLAVFVVLGIIGTYIFVVKPQTKEELPIYNPVDIEEDLVDPELLRVGMGHKIGDFSFQNQDGKTITQDVVKNHVYVAEYFFTTCKSICPIMNNQMQRVQKAYKDEDAFKILSFTVDPEIDTVAQMKWYADSHGAIKNKWHFLTGEKEELYQLARKSFFLLKPSEVPKLGDGGSDFIHTNNFVLIDRLGRIRGYYDGTDEDEVNGLCEEIGDHGLVIWGVGDRSTEAARLGARGHTSGISVLFAKAGDLINNAQRAGNYDESETVEKRISALEEIRFENGRVYNYSAVVEAMIQSGFSDIDPGEGGPFNPPVSQEVAVRIKDAISGIVDLH